MKISTSWIKDYVDLENEDLKDVADKVTNCGVNIEEIEGSQKIDNLVVGYVISCELHPNSDHLHVCKVDVKDEVLQIVCGAPNVKEGQKVIVAKCGAVLPENFKIEDRNIRGVDSHGMICALSELGLTDIYLDGIHILDDDALIGEDAFKYISADTVYTLDLNPNRNDCLSHLGFAYEVASVLGKDVKTPEIHYKESEEDIKDSFELIVNTKKCPLAIFKLVKNVKIDTSPSFIKERLESVGMRSINNLVDISNYVMLEYGQPLHFYDADKVGELIEIRDAKEGENITTLDEKERILSSNDIVITDGNKPIAIAGIMGGENTEITEDTKNILIESAIFDALSVRKTYIKLDLRSEASIRFEKGLNYEYTYEAISRSCHLLEKYANGISTKGMRIHDNINKSEKKVKISLEKINRILGLDLTIDIVMNCLDNLGFEYSNELEVTIPNRRMDVSIEEDIIEEIGRIYGFDKIVSKVPVQKWKKGKYSDKIKYRKDISKRMRSIGLNEVKTYTLVNGNDATIFNYEKNIIKLDRPISKVKTHIRASLIPSLLEVVKYNESRNVEDINIYEISNVYYEDNNDFLEALKLCVLIKGTFCGNPWQNKKLTADFYLLKGIIEDLLNYLSLSDRVKYEVNNVPNFMHPRNSANILIDNESIGFLGKLHPNISKEEIFICEINLDKLYVKKAKKLKYEEPSKYPNVNRDLAFLFDKNIVIGEVLKTIKSSSKILINTEIFDIFEKDGKKSIAFSLTFNDKEKTLTEDEINIILSNIIDDISKKYNGILRDK